MSGNLSDFNIQTYVRFLRFLANRYEITSFARFSEKSNSFLILRHDVDLSLEAALRMARLEEQMGVASTYLVHLYDRFYSVFDPSCLDMLRLICRMGHEVGLHYDVVRYESYARPMRQTLLDEIAILRRLTRQEVRTFAMHNPSLYRSDPLPRMRGYVNAYTFNKDFDVFYVSDSCRAWRIRDAHTLIARNPPRVQLLIHPFQWVLAAGNRFSLLDKWFSRLEKENRKYKARWKSLCPKLPYVRRYDKEIRTQERLLDFPCS